MYVSFLHPIRFTWLFLVIKFDMIITGRKRALRMGHSELHEHEPLLPPLPCNPADAQQSAFPCGVLSGRAPALFDWFSLNLATLKLGHP
jgi:hypothetical protein